MKYDTDEICLSMYNLCQSILAIEVQHQFFTISLDITVRLELLVVASKLGSSLTCL